jgi:small GTP-binding protein
MGKVLRAKIVLIGDGGVGKSSFRRTWLGELFQAQYLMTLGADFAAKEVALTHGPTNTDYLIKYQIWDLAGQPRFRVVNNLYYRGAVAALCFFDITNPHSFESIGEWLNSFLKLNGQGNRPFLIVGAKGDLRKLPIGVQVPAEQAINYAEKVSRSAKPDHGFSVHYIETSAKENTNVEETFKLLSIELINSLIHKQGTKSRSERASISTLGLPPKS